jgi:hypothetical protein
MQGFGRAKCSAPIPVAPCCLLDGIFMRVQAKSIVLKEFVADCYKD